MGRLPVLRHCPVILAAQRHEGAAQRAEGAAGDDREGPEAQLEKMEKDLKDLSKLYIEDLKDRAGAATSSSSSPKVRPGNGPGGRGGAGGAGGGGQVRPGRKPQHEHQAARLANVQQWRRCFDALCWRQLVAGCQLLQQRTCLPMQRSHQCCKCASPPSLPLPPPPSLRREQPTPVRRRPTCLSGTPPATPLALLPEVASDARVCRV